MLTVSSKKTTILLTLLMLTFGFYSVFNGQQAGRISLNNEGHDQVKTATKSRRVNTHRIEKISHSRLSQQGLPQQTLTKPKLLPQDWLAAFQNAYPTDVKTVDKLMDVINVEPRPEFIEQLLRQVQFLADRDPVRLALENSLISRLAQLDPSRAADYILAAVAQQKQPANLNPSLPYVSPGFTLPQFNLPAQPFFMENQLISSLMQSWGEKDLPQAIDWALTLEDEQLKHQALNLLSYTRDELKIDKMAEAVNHLPQGNARSGLLSQLAEQKAQIDPDVAVAWVSNWPDSLERNQAISTLISSRTSQSLEDTAMLVEQALATGMNPDETATDMLINQWWYKSPEEAYQWASNLPDSAVKNRALLLLDSMREAATQLQTTMLLK